MNERKKWAVVYEVPDRKVDFFYGSTPEEAMQVVIDNGEIGAVPLYAYDPLSGPKQIKK